MRSIVVEMPPVENPTFPDNVFSIRDFGAVGDGVTMNTEAINQAIAACSNAGGGKVVIPPGLWLTGPIRLLNHVNLHAEQGALIMFSRNFDDYSLIHTSYEGIRTVRCMSPIYGENVHDAAITGKGVFDGGGDAWRPVKRSKMADNEWKALTLSGGVTDPAGKIWWPTERAMSGAGKVKQWLREGVQDIYIFREARDFLRPALLQLDRCRRIMLDGPTFQNSASWCLHPWLCEHVTIRQVTVRNPWYSQNGDGLDLDSCRFAEVTGSYFDVGDDAICLKSGKDEDGRRLGAPCEYVSIRDCTVYHGHGGFVIGSEMSGDVRNVRITDCLFIGTDNGLRFKTAHGRGGVVENIEIRNIRMTGITKEAITFSMYYGHSDDSELADRPVTEETPAFRNFYLHNIQCIGANRALAMTGLPEQPLQNIYFQGVYLRAKKGISLAFVQDIEFDGLGIEADDSLFSIHDGRGIRIAVAERNGTTDAVLEVSGKRTKDIRLEGFEQGRLKVISAAEADASQIGIAPISIRRE